MIVANESDDFIRVQRSTKNSYLLSWHKSQGLGLPISLKNYAGIIGQGLMKTLVKILVVLSCMVTYADNDKMVVMQ